jgi:hypothetical protein
MIIKNYLYEAKLKEIIAMKENLDREKQNLNKVAKIFQKARERLKYLGRGECVGIDLIESVVEMGEIFVWAWGKGEKRNRERSGNFPWEIRQFRGFSF